LFSVPLLTEPRSRIRHRHARSPPIARPGLASGLLARPIVVPVAFHCTPASPPSRISPHFAALPATVGLDHRRARTGAALDLRRMLTPPTRLTSDGCSPSPSRSIITARLTAVVRKYRPDLVVVVREHRHRRAPAARARRRA
jgi:hypothetical protein